MEGPSRLAAHVVDDHDDREVRGRRRRAHPRRDRRAACFRWTIARSEDPRPCASRRRSSRCARAAHGCRARRETRRARRAVGRPGMVDDHETAGRDPVVERVERRPDLGRDRGRRPAAVRPRRSAPRRASGWAPLQEDDAVVEQREPGESLANGVEAGRGVIGTRVLLRVEPISDPNPRPGKPVRLKEPAHEDRSAPATGAAVDQIAADGLVADDFHTSLEVIQAPAPDCRVRTAVPGTGGIVEDRVAQQLEVTAGEPFRARVH